MLSLIIGVIQQYFLKYLYLNKTEQEDIDIVISRIESSRDPTEQKKEILNKEGCYYRTGSITRITTNYILIDDRYVYEKYDDSTDNMKVGNKVYYLAFLRNPGTELKVRKIIYVINNEDWDNTAPQSEEDVIQMRMIQKSMIAKVTKREGRIAIVEPNNIRIDLSKVQSEFIPLIGDWLTLESLVEVNDDSKSANGEILEVDKIKPLRSKLDVGEITKYDPKNQVGIIDKSVIFHKGACEPGYVPCIGDKVVSDSIESDQGLYKWRSITVVSLVQNSNEPVELTSTDDFRSVLSNTRDLLKNKHGIIIDDGLKFNLNIGEEDTLMVTIRNIGDCSHTLQNGTFMRQKSFPSQLSVTSPENTDINTVINPSENTSYTFKCKAEFIGKSEELFIFNFKDFKIGRLFHVTVNIKNVLRDESVLPPSVTYGNNQKNNFVNPDDLNDATYIPGVRPFRPAAFVKVRNGIFKVPRYIWDAVLNIVQNDKSQIEREIALADEIPCLLKPLTFETYKERFHILLYLEEVAQVINLQQYDIKSAIMRRRGEYLTLEVPGLSEKRPSLLVGDRAVISFQWDDSQGNLKYEGYIHKVTGSEIFLKFNEKFHQEYNSEDCQVTFKCSQTTIQRCHNAVNLAVNRLGLDFLFPTKIVEKEPQYHLEEHDIEEKPVRKRINRSNKSLSSSNSITSGSETSLESIVRTSPRVSVVERLFNVKPVESSAVEAKMSIATAEISSHETEIMNHQINIASSDISNESNITSEKTSKSAVQIDDEMEPYINQIKKRKLNWFNKHLNYYQREAVKNILNGVARPLPYVIFGPPGTGKTVTLCETILQIFNVISESRLLVATPSNSSANLIAERLLDANILKPGDLVRLIAHHCLNDDSIPERLLPYCATAELGAEGTVEQPYSREDGLKLNCTMSVLGRHRITIGTCSTLGILYNIGFPRGHFTHVLVDEAGQATEPEIMIPLSFIHSDHGQVILAGDSMQLGPTVQSKFAAYYGFDESFLSRLLHQFPYQRDPEGFENCYDSRLVTKLLLNYRSLPEILDLPNSLFYESELQPYVSPKKSQEAKLLETLRAELPERNGSPPAIVFHGVDGENCKDSESPSWYNQEEAIQVYLYLLKLYKYGLGPDDIGIITPYYKQVMKIKDLMLELDLEVPKVSSVEGFQGQERNVIILSVVRSCDNLVDQDIKHALGFVASPRRLNVAITRARALLIIIGNPKLLAMDPYWRSVLIYCIDRGAYTGCNFLPSYMTDLQDI